MEKLKFNISINAPREKVWETLWEDESYRKWTRVFSEGSHVETDHWKEGSKVLFLDGKGMGMVSKIAKNTPNQYMSIEHLGMVKDGIEDTSSEAVKGWAGAMENYTLKENNGNTELFIDMDSNEEYKDYFKKIWPLALDEVKRIAES